MRRAARFAISSAAVKGAVALVGGAELHHMRDVMRLRAGARVALFDESGAEYDGVIRNYHAGHAVVEIAPAPGARAEAASDVIIAAAMIKGARMDFLVEKAAELGAAELWPLIAERAVTREVGDERLKRWRRLATAAAKQSLAPRPTAVSAPLGIGDLIRRCGGGRLCVVLRPAAPPLGAVLRHARRRSLLLACGPEGDFSGDELAAMEAAGFVAAGLGGRRLRSETAALAALSIAADAFDELVPRTRGED